MARDERHATDAPARSGLAHDARPLRTGQPAMSEEPRGARVVIGAGSGMSSLFESAKERKVRRKKRAHHTRKRVAVFRYGYYDIAFQFFVEQVLDAEYIALPQATKRSLELGSRYSSDFVCAPFKHILGDYIEALELGADVLVQVTGPCRLGYYGELQESILRDMGYEFEMLNFATLAGAPATDYIKICQKTVNPDLSVPHGVRNMLVLLKMIEYLDDYNDRYLEVAGFSADIRDAERARERYYADMRAVTCERELAAAQRAGLDALEAVEKHVPERPVRVGVVGEYFTAPVPHANLHVEDKLARMGVSLARFVNMTHRNLHYNEQNLRASASDYITYDMGPTSSMTVAATLKYAQEGFDGVIHLKSSGCTPEVDCMPVLQRISRDTGMPILYLSYDAQTSDTGLDTRLEAFYDMLARRKGSTR